MIAHSSLSTRGGEGDNVVVVVIVVVVAMAVVVAVGALLVNMGPWWPLLDGNDETNMSWWPLCSISEVPPPLSKLVTVL